MNPLIAALDCEPGQVKGILKKLKSQINIFKIGNRLFTAMGPQVIDWVHQTGGKVFLDLKFHDIPQTVAESCRNAVKMKVWGFTVHTSGGNAMMEAAARVTAEESKRLKIDKPVIFGVTVLTSLQNDDLRQIGILRSSQKQVKHLALMAKKAGLNGVVASGNEIKSIRNSCGDKFLVAVPGIRLAKDGKDDQKRVVGPQEACELGANYIVVGRPILDARDPVAAAREILRMVSNYKK